LRDRDYIQQDTEQLLSRMTEGDQEAFRAIFKMYWKDCYRIAYSKLNSKELAEEATQNIFVSLWERRGQVEIKNLKAYLFTSIKYQIINIIEAKVLSKKHLGTLSNVTQTKNDVEQYIFEKDLFEAMELALKSLPPKTMRVYQMSRIEHLTGKQIALKLGLSEKSVEYHMSKALKLLRVELKDYLVSNTAAISIIASLLSE